MHHDSHGLCYDVRHDDGTEGCYDPSEFEVITIPRIMKDDFDRYLTLVREAEILKEKMTPHAREIAQALHLDAQTIGFAAGLVYTAGRFDSVAGTFQAELLWDPNWRRSVADHLERQRIHYEKEHERLEKQAKAEVERRERAELERLRAKYP
jgi:hypothetical protein